MLRASYFYNVKGSGTLDVSVVGGVEVRSIYVSKP